MVNEKRFKSSPYHLSIYFLLRNRPKCFEKPVAIVTELSEYEKVIATTLKSFYTRQPPRDIFYKSYILSSVILSNFSAKQYLAMLN